MAITCTPEHLIERLHGASASDDAFVALRSLVYSHSWAEEDYHFSAPELEGVFAALSAYFDRKQRAEIRAARLLDIATLLRQRG